MKLRFIISGVPAIFFLLAASGCDRPTENDQADDGLPPAVPVGVSLYFAGDGEILIEWNNNNEADLKGYKIYKSVDNADFINITFTTDTYFLDDSLDYDSTYFYRVSAVDTRERESSLSPEISAKPENKYPPDPPRYIDINARNWEGMKSVYLSWQPNSETDIAGYNIYRNTSESFSPDSLSLIGHSDKESWADTVNLSLLTTYYYKIRSIDKGGLISSQSAEVYDKILRIPEIIYPGSDEFINYFGNFKFTAAGAPAVYKLLVQTNPIFGSIWEKDINSNTAEDTLEVQFDYPYAEANKEYYFRVACYTVSSNPNSVTKLYKFKIRP